ncbi:type II toxin-antitoxin system Phd/YefM family antitoxin [Lacunimicrobium album]
MIIRDIDAQPELFRLLDAATNGIEVTITRDGTPIARLLPVNPPASLERRKSAVENIRNLSQRNALGDSSLQTLRDEGRR